MISSTFSFKFLQKKISLLAFFLEIFSCTSQEWYRKLPERSLPSFEIPLGTYKKKLKSRSPLNSRIIFHKDHEQIILLSQNEFTRYYESTWIEGAQTKKKILMAQGKYQTKGNWVLLETKKIQYKNFEGGALFEERTLDTKHRLLYYFWKNEKVLIPMMYEKAYEEKNFGVKDGVQIPYDDSNPYFQRYLRFYTFEEYQPHAYFLEE